MSGDGRDMPMPMPPMAPMPPMPTPMAPMAPMGPMGPGTMNNGSMNMYNMVMHMSFFWGKDVTVLFPGWPNGSLGMYILALLFVFFLSFAVEILSMVSLPSRVKSSVLGGLVFALGHGVKMALAYMVMLSVMTFNLGVFIVAVIGHAVGGFLVKYRSLSKRAAAGSDELPPSTIPKP